MSYPPESAGALMDPRVLAVSPDSTVGQVLATLRGFRNRRVRRIFLIDSQGRPVGAVPLQEIAMARPGDRLGDLPPSPTESVAATAGREEVVEVLERTRQSSVPVVDFAGHILGVLRDDVLMGAAQQEATADIQTMVGASREERALSPVSFAVRKRLPGSRSTCSPPSWPPRWWARSKG
jgi:magnesium transporter